MQNINSKVRKTIVPFILMQLKHHNVLIRHRSKIIYRGLKHYHVSTNLGLLQANLARMQEMFGIDYIGFLNCTSAWVSLLLDGVKEALANSSKRRRYDRVRAKTTSVKKKENNVEKTNCKKLKECGITHCDLDD